MKDLRKVIWAEGIFLGQQHFQQWERYHEGQQQVLVHGLNPMSWGFLDLKIDEKTLENGRFSLNRCTVIFPCGQLVTYTGEAGKSLPCDLGGHGGEKLDVFLCIPANHEVKGISGYTDRGEHCAWRADYHQISDIYDSQREREILLGDPNLVLKTSEDSLEQFYSIKIAEVLNRGDGRYHLVDEYIPAVIQIATSPTLRNVLNRIVEIVGARSKELGRRLREASGGSDAFLNREPLNFHLLLHLNRVLPELLHFQKKPELHPETLYRSLCQLFGALVTFNPAQEIHLIPPYQHEDLFGVFHPLERALGDLLQITLPAVSSSLSFSKENEALLSVSEIEQSLLRSGTLFLAVLADLDDPSWITDFSRHVKVSSRQSIEMVVSSALPGVRLVHTQRPPTKLSTKTGYEYFRLEAKGDFWNKIVEEQSLAVFLPQKFQNAAVELVRIEG